MIEAKLHKQFKLNKQGRDFVVGDIHGEYTKLQTALDAVDFNTKTDRLFAVGDLVDRGPENLRTLGLLEQPWFHSVIGNHEQMMVAFFDNLREGQLWIPNGGDWYFKEVENNPENQLVFTQLLERVKQLPVAITVKTNYGTVGICHAQCPFSDWNAVKGATIGHYDKEEILWGRTQIKYGPMEPVKGVTYTFHGHTPAKRPIINGNRIFIDNGAVFGGHLPLVINITEDPLVMIVNQLNAFVHHQGNV